MAGYLARADQARIARSRHEVAALVEQGRWDERSLYVFTNDALWARAQEHLSVDDRAGVLNGFRVVAPGLGRCRECRTAELEPVVLDREHVSRIVLDKVVMSEGAEAPAGSEGAFLRWYPSRLLTTRPYVDLVPGRYCLELRGHAPRLVNAWVDVTASKGQRVLARFDLGAGFSPESDTVLFRGFVTVEEYLDGVEVRLFDDPDSEVMLTGLVLMPLAE